MNEFWLAWSHTFIKLKLHRTLYHAITRISNKQNDLKEAIDKQSKLLVQQEMSVVKDGRSGIIRGITSRGVQIAFGGDGKTILETTRIVDMHKLKIPGNVQVILDELLPMLQLRIERRKRSKQTKEMAFLAVMHEEHGQVNDDGM